MKPRDFAVRTTVLLLLGCGGEDAAPVAEAQPAPEPPPAAAAELEPDPQDGFSGTWYIFMPELPWTALRLAVLPSASGQQVSWISFDWSASDSAEDLSSRSKPVAVTLAGDVQAATIDGPSPMISESSQPNGQSGSWHIELRPALDGPARLVGRAYHTGLTGEAGVPAEMTREFRPWQRP